MENTSTNSTDSTTTKETFPEWLNKDYFKDILDKDFEQYEIQNFTIANATTKGENYASSLLRVSIDLTFKDGTAKTTKYIVKTMLSSELSQNFTEMLGVFPKETEIYEKVIPRMTQMYQEAGLDFIAGPKCYKSQASPPVIVLEDLGADGYANINRVEGMDLEHAQATLSKLARWHASSARIYELYGPYSEKFTRGMIMPEVLPMMQQMLSGIWPIVETCMLEWGDCEKYIERLKSMNERYIELVLATQSINPDEFNVMNHGDLWCNNIMFKHNADGSIDDVKFVDLQVCNWGSPVLDLQYFMITSCSYDIRISKYDYLVKYYHDRLVENLKLLQYQGQVPKLVDLQIQMLKRGYISLQVAFGTMSMVLLDPTEKAEIEMFLLESDAGTVFKKQVYSTPRYVKAAKSILEFLDNRGILDI